MQEELRGQAAGLVGPRFPVPATWLHPTLRFCFAGLLRRPDVYWHQSCFFRKTKGQEAVFGELKGCMVVTVTVSEEESLFQGSLAGENQELLNLKTKDSPWW